MDWLHNGDAIISSWPRLGWMMLCASPTSKDELNDMRFQASRRCKRFMLTMTVGLLTKWLRPVLFDACNVGHDDTNTATVDVPVVVTSVVADYAKVN